MKRALALTVLSVLLLVAGVASAQGPAPAAGASPFSVGAEALMWWFKGNATPPLVTDGTLGAPGTRVLVGGDDVDTNVNPGFRLSAAYALTPRWSVESNVFYVPTRSTSRSVSASGQPGSTDILLPFFDATLPGESVTTISSVEKHYAGTAREQLSNSLLGSELNASTPLAVSAGWRLDVLGGFRYLRLRETYLFTTDSPNIPPAAPDVFRTRDEFDATNNFFGGQLGLRGQGDWGPWFADGVIKVALGAMVQSADLEGSVVTNDFNGLGAPQTFAGGYLALPTNSGHHTRHVLSVVPEAGLTVGYRITPWLSVIAGYTFLYASAVVRAPRQINRVVNPTGRPAYDDPGPAPGPAEPSFRFKPSDFWAQGLNVGLAVQF